MHIYLLLFLFNAIILSCSAAHIELSDLSLDQKIGQLFMVTAVADEEIAHQCSVSKSYRMDKEHIATLIRDYHIGGIIFLGKSDIKKQVERTEYFQSLAAIPLLIGQDLEPGRVGKARFDCFTFPSNQILGNIDSETNTYEVAQHIGHFCKSLGVHINFAPVADVNNNPANPIINDRSFGDNPVLVSQYARAFARGLTDSGIIACAKHFPGHGDTICDSHEKLPVLEHNRERLDAIELYPFNDLIKDNIPAIMIGHLAVPTLDPEDTPASLSKKIVTDLLRNELQFKGLIITDALDMKAITNSYAEGEAELNALIAGNDILLCPMDVAKAVVKIKSALQEGTITEQEIDMHVEKIIQIKNK